MQSAPFNQRYAASIPELRPRYAQACNDSRLILDLLLSDPEWDFGSAAWFLTTQCTSEQRALLQTARVPAGSDTAWEVYIQSCLGRAATPARKQYWDRAIHELVGST
jgi:hypothetical protein